MPNCWIGDKVIQISSSAKYLAVYINDTIINNNDIKRQTEVFVSNS